MDNVFGFNKNPQKFFKPQYLASNNADPLFRPSKN
jgi:hypothetical protein